MTFILLIKLIFKGWLCEEKREEIKVLKKEKRYITKHITNQIV